MKRNRAKPLLRDKSRRSKIIRPISAASSAEFEKFQRRTDVVRENPYLLGGKFVGREKELADFTGWLKDESGVRRMLCVCDFGGAGKTALVWHWLNLEETKDIRAELGYREYWATFYAQDYGWRSFVEGLATRFNWPVPPADDYEAWNETIGQVLERLKEDRWLIVLDGLEREMEIYTSEITMHMDSEEHDVRKDQGTIRIEERYLQSRQFSKFLKGLLATPTKILITTRMMPEDLKSGQRLCAGVEEYKFQPLLQDEAIKLWWAHTNKSGSSELLSTFFDLVGYHPQLIAIVAAAVEASESSTFGEWFQEFSSGEQAECFQRSALKTTLRFRWLALATRDLLKKKSKAWILLCLIIARSNASSVENLKQALIREDSTSPFRDERTLIGAILELQKRCLLGYDTASRMVDVHPVVRSHTAKYIVRIWKQERPDEFAAEILDNLRRGLQSRDAFLRLLSVSNLDEAARQLDESYAPGSYLETFNWMKEFYPGQTERPWLDGLPNVSLRKLQASVLNSSAYAASALGHWHDAAILQRRAKLAFQLCGEYEKVLDCERGENWQRLYGGSLYECEKYFLELLQSGRASNDSTLIYWLALSLSIRQHERAESLLDKIGPGQTRWTKQTAAEAYYYLKKHAKAVEILKTLEDGKEPAHPAQQLWEWVTLGMAQLRLGEFDEAGRNLAAAQRGSAGFFYRIVLLFSQSSFAEFLYVQAMKQQKSGNPTARLTLLEEAQALLVRTARMDKNHQFQIPMAEAHLSLAHVILALDGDNHEEACDHARKSLEIAKGKDPGFEYKACVTRVEKFLKDVAWKDISLDIPKQELPKHIRAHEQKLNKYLDDYTGRRPKTSLQEANAQSTNVTGFLNENTEVEGAK